MPLTRAQAIAQLDMVIAQLNQLKDNLEKLPAQGQAASAVPKEYCQVHNVPWRHTAYGFGHPLGDGSGKWCNKVSPRTGRRAS